MHMCETDILQNQDITSSFLVVLARFFCDCVGEMPIFLATYTSIDGVASHANAGCIH